MKALKSLLIVSLVLFFAVIFSEQASAEVTAPKIIKLVGSENFMVAGLAPAGSEVLIYLDGNFVGQTEAGVVLEPTAANFNFQYRGSSKLADGTHTVMAVAKDKTSLVLSAPSNEVKFAVNFLPAPTLIAPDEKTITAQVKPLIIGLTKSGSLVKIFIDDVYNGRTGILNDESDTANFAYKPVRPLERGNHLVYAVAEDNRGKQSAWSNIVYFSTKSSAIAESVQEEKSETVASIKEPGEAVKNNAETPVISKSSGVIEKEPEQTEAIKELSQSDQAGLEKIKNLLGDDAGEKIETGQGMINEGKINQGKLKLSLVLFILFLVGVVAWLLWVNRELVKERRAQNEAGDKAGKDEANQAAGGQKDKLL